MLSLDGESIPGEGLGEVLGDHAVIVGSGAECLEHQSLSGLDGELVIVPLHLLQDSGVAARVGDDRHPLVVLGRRPDEGWTADIDVLDYLLQVGGVLEHGFPEWVEVHHHQVHPLQTHVLELGHMVGAVPSGQYSGEQGRMQRLHPPVQHLREPGQLGDPDGVDALLVEQRGSAPGGHDLHTQLPQSLGEVDDPGLVRNADHSALDTVQTLASWNVMAKPRGYASGKCRQGR